MSEGTGDRRDHSESRQAADAAANIVRVASEAAAQVLATATQAAQLHAATMTLDLQYIKDDLKEIKQRLDSKFVSLDVFDPIRNLVYGLVALILTAVIGAVLTLVLRQ